MVTGFKTWLYGLVGVVLIGLMLFASPGIIAHAQAGTKEDLLAKSIAIFIKSMTADYTEYVSDSFRENIDSVYKNVVELNALVEKVVLNNELRDKEQIAQNISKFENKLKEIARSFDKLAENTESYDQTLELSLRKALTSIKGEIKDNFQKTEKGYSDVAKAISNIANLSGQANELNLKDIASELTDSVRGLQRAIKFAEEATQAMAG